MSLIDNSYFVGPLYVAQLGQPDVAEQMQYYIDRYEKEFLTAALGYGLYKSFKDGLAIDPIDQKWVDIRDGKEFINTAGWWPYALSGSVTGPFYNSNQPVQWNGFSGQPEQPNQASPIAAYVYVKYMRDLYNQVTGIGTVKAASDAATNVPPNWKLTDRWNDMCDSVYTLWQLLQTSGTSVYPDFLSSNIDYHRFRKENIWGI
jgi:hypothetical protein